MIAIVLAVIVVVGVVAYIALVIIASRNAVCDCGSRPTSIGMVGGVPTTAACGITTNALYTETVSVTSTWNTVTTSNLGLKIVPTDGGVAVNNVAPPASSSACPTSGGYYVSLENSADTVVACWSGGLIAWSYPTSGACSNSVGAILSSAVTLQGGDSLVVYMYGTNVVPPMAGAYTMEAFGLSSSTVSGSVDL
jgi:hypothetical protein